MFDPPLDKELGPPLDFIFNNQHRCARDFSTFFVLHKLFPRTIHNLLHFQPVTHRHQIYTPFFEQRYNFMSRVFILINASPHFDGDRHIRNLQGRKKTIASIVHRKISVLD